jgi:hypothetical protein
VSVSAAGSSSTLVTTEPSLLTILAQASATAAQSAQQREIGYIDTDINNRLNAQIATLQGGGDDAIVSSLQQQISSLDDQQTAINKLSSQYGGNASILADLQDQIATMMTAAGNGNGGSFDNALAAANTDVGDLTVVTPQAPFQPDRIAGLKGTGLGIGASATYDLSTPTGQDAATAAVQSAQTLVGEIFQATNANQQLAISVSQSLGSQSSGLNAQLSQLQQSGQSSTATQIAQLQQRAQDQEHVIELSLGNTQLLSSVLTTLENPPQPVNSVFVALEGAVGATPSTYNALTTAPPILSLLT